MTASNTSPAVIVSHLSKKFKIPTEAHNGLKQKLINTLKGRKGYRDFTPLKDISFTIEEGDFFGIVGRNGSGKSTLLKTIAGIYSPNEGEVHVNGKLVPFIELGVGFNPELTGRENVFLNGALLGFSRTEMEAMYDEIVDFAELHDFMEERLKNYSSGMQVRLAFSIAIRADGDILLLDEVLAVGDEAFQRKCFDYFAEIKESGKTVILVTHSMDSIKQFCTKAILINQGEIVASGSPESVAYKYELLNSKKVIPENVEKKDDTQWGTRDVVIQHVKFAHTDMDEDVVHTGDDFDLEVYFLNKSKNVSKINFSLGVYAQGVKCFDISTYYGKALDVGGVSKGKIVVRFSDFRLLPGVYDCNMSIFNEDMSIVHHSVLKIFAINVIGDRKDVAATGIVKTSSDIFLNDKEA